MWLYPETQITRIPVPIGDSTCSNFAFSITGTDSTPTTLAWALGTGFNTSDIVTSNTWTHYAIVRKNGEFTIYKNGTSIGSSLDDMVNKVNYTAGQERTVLINFASLVLGGYTNGTTEYRGYIDDVAVWDYAKYDGDFTAPTEPIE